MDQLLKNLKAEIALQRPFVSQQEATFLSLAWTWLNLEKLGRMFFSSHGISDAQFNALMILHDYREQRLKQHELATLLVVNRASAGGLIDRMERNKWVKRLPDPADRRASFVVLTEAGKAKLEEVRGQYYQALAKLFDGIDQATLQSALQFHDVLRRHAAEQMAGAAAVKATVGK